MDATWEKSNWKGGMGATWAQELATTRCARDKRGAMSMILDAFASYLTDLLAQVTREEVGMLFGVSGEIRNLGNKLGDLKAFLVDTERRHITDQLVQRKVRELKDAMYDTTDILDLCHLKAMDQRGAYVDLGCHNPLLFCLRNPLFAHDIGSCIKALHQRLDNIKEWSAAFSFVNLGSYEDRGRRAYSSRPAANRENTGDLSGRVWSGRRSKKTQEHWWRC